MVLSLAEVARVEGRVAEMVGVVNTAVAGLVALVTDVLDRGAWEGHGIRSPEHWLTWQTGVSPARARTLVAIARRLPELPATRAAFERGELTEDQVRLICAVVDPAHDEQAVEFARLMMVPQLARALRGLTPISNGDAGSDDGEATPRACEERCEVAFGFDDAGDWWLRARLPSDEGALVQRALERARDAEFKLRHPGAEPAPGVRDDVTWADALLRLADAGLDDLAPKGRPSQRYQVLLHVPAEGLAAAYLHLGPSVDDSVRRYHECDATVRYVLEAGGKIVALSRKQDTVDDKTRVLIEDRDGGCRVSGCRQRRWLHIHHIRHRRDGGETVPENLCCLCPHHHRLHHRGLLGIEGDPTRPDGLVFTTPGGRVLGKPSPKPPGRPPPEAARHLGLPEPRWQHPTGERVDWRWLDWS